MTFKKIENWIMGNYIIPNFYYFYHNVANKFLIYDIDKGYQCNISFLSGFKDKQHLDKFVSQVDNLLKDDKDCKELMQVVLSSEKVLEICISTQDGKSCYGKNSNIIIHLYDGDGNFVEIFKAAAKQIVDASLNENVLPNKDFTLDIPPDYDYSASQNENVLPRYTDIPPDYDYSASQNDDILPRYTDCILNSPNDYNYSAERESSILGDV